MHFCRLLKHVLQSKNFAKIFNAPNLIRMQHTLVIAASFLMTNEAFSNPVLNNVGAGNVNISQSGSTTTVNQNSQQAVINWNSFNIRKGEKTQFIQPNRSATALNRINPNQGASQIYGTLSANGKVILINGAGIHFGASAMVNVAGIIASTTDISDTNFMAGKYIFDKPSTLGGSILNEGAIIAAQQGLVALTGTNVTNKGFISAHLGNIVLASGNTFTFDFYGDQLINFSVDSQTSTASKVTNTGKLLADGGQIMVTAKTAQGVLDNVIDMSGIAEANSVSQQGGVIILSANGNVSVSGKLIAAGKQHQSHGGTIEVLGNNVTLESSAVLNTNGDAGGGKIIVGGNPRGTDFLQNALTTIIKSGAVLSANAMTTGNGGNIVVWSDNSTIFHGSISATGGALSGNGGNVETSGAYLDTHNSSVYLLAPQGQTGTWLLDPSDLTICANCSTSASNNNNTFGTNGINSYLSATDLMTALNTANVSLQTTSNGTDGYGDINVNAAIHWLSDSTLSLTAYNRIYLNADITAPQGSLVLSATNIPQSISSGTEIIPSMTGVNANIAVSQFDLQQGKWYQNNSILPTFSASDNFMLNTPSNAVEFIRVRGGDGSTLTPYVLTDIYGLQGINSSSTALSSNYQLGNDIDASATSHWSNGEGFQSINGFAGILDGQNHTINHYYSIQNGIFASNTSESLIENIVLNNASLTLTNQRTGTFGLLIGINNGAVTNATVTASSITNIDDLGAEYMGGIIGLNNGETSHLSVSHLTISNTDTRGDDIFGGIIAQNAGDANHLTSNDVLVKNADGNGFEIFGGLIGQNQNSLNNSTVTNVTLLNSDTIGGFEIFGGMVGQNNGIISSAASQNVTINNMDSGIGFEAFGGLVGQNNDNLIHSTSNNTTLNNFDTMSGFQILGGMVGQNNDFISSLSSSATYIDNTNTLNGNELVGGLIGQSNASVTTTFGNNITINSQDTGGVEALGGLIGQNNGTVHTSYIKNGAINNVDHSSGTESIGGLIGLNQNSIDSSYSIVTLINNDAAGNEKIGGLIGINTGGTLTTSYSNNTIINNDNGGGTEMIGGLIGVNQTSIYQVYNRGNIINNDGNGAETIGGLVGLNQNGLIDAYSMTNITNNDLGNGLETIGGFVGNNAGNINNAYSTGLITNNKVGAIIGGFAGANSALISNAFWDINTSSVNTSAAGTGITTAAMMLQSTYCLSGDCNGNANYFDFTNTWGIYAGDGVDANGSYPFLLAFGANPRVISGFASNGSVSAIGLGNQTVGLTTNSNTIDTVTTGNNGLYYFLESNGTVVDNTAFITYLKGNTTSNVVTLAPTDGGSITLLNMQANTIQVGGGTENLNGVLTVNPTQTISNTDLASATSGVPANDLLYSANGNDITLSNNNLIGTTLQTHNNLTYDINGKILSYGNEIDNLLFNGSVIVDSSSVSTTGNQTYNENMTVNTDTTLNTSQGNLTLSTINGGNSTMRFIANGSITLNGDINTNSSEANALVLSDGINFINNAGINALSATNSRFLLYSVDPSKDVLDGITLQDKYYHASLINNNPIGLSNQTENSALYTIAPTLTITVNNTTTIYGTAPSLTYSVSGFVDGDTASVLTGNPNFILPDIINVTGSSYTINASEGSLTSHNNNYGLAFVNGKLTVTPALLTITANNQNISYGQKFSTTGVTYSGFVNGDTSNSLSSLAIVSATPSSDGQFHATNPATSTRATNNSPFAPYALTLTSGTNPNYEINYISGNLYVSPTILNFNVPTGTHAVAVNMGASTTTISGHSNLQTEQVQFIVDGSVASSSSFLLTDVSSATITSHLTNSILGTAKSIQIQPIDTAMHTLTLSANPQPVSVDATNLMTPDNTLVPITFGNPTMSLAIVGNSNNNIITINGMASNYVEGLTANTSGAVNVNGLNGATPNTLTLVASTINLNSNINLPISTLNLTATAANLNSASITSSNSDKGITANITVGNFNLIQGGWYQDNSVLPTLSVTHNFFLNSIPNSAVQFIRASSGNGTIATPYTITDIYGLEGIGSNKTTLAANYRLANNIDATTSSNWNNGIGFLAIGNNSADFTGTLNGQGYTVSNLYINNTSSSVANNPAGLFGVTNNSTINNIKVSGNISGITYVGSLIGLAQNTTVNNATVLSNTQITLVASNNGSTAIGGLIGISTNSNLTNLKSSATVLSSSSNVSIGGLIGYNNGGSINTATSNGIITFGNNTSNNNVGGLIGVNTGTVNNAESTVTLNAANSSINSNIGGLVGYNTGTIASSTNASNFTAGNNSQDTNLAGFVALNTGAISNSTNTGTVTGGSNSKADYIAGLVAVNNGGAITQAFNSGSITEGNNSSYGDVAGLVADNNTIRGSSSHSGQGSCSSNNNSYSNTVFSGTISNSYNTGTVSGGNLSSQSNVSGLVSINSGSIINSYNAASVSGGNGAVTANSNQGGSCGNNHSSNITYSTNSNLAGLVAVNNGSVSGSYNTSGGTVSGGNYSEHGNIGGLIANNSGNVTGSYNNATVSAGSNSQAVNIGGLAGYNSGSINSSYNQGSIQAGNNIYQIYIGGLVGYNISSISNSTNYGNVSNGQNNSAVYISGIAGYNQGTVSHSTSKGNVFK